MTEYPTYWNRQQETLSAEEFRSGQEKAFLNQLNYVWQNSDFYIQKFTETAYFFHNPGPLFPGQNQIPGNDHIQ